MSASTLGKRKQNEPSCKFGPCIVSEEHMNTYMRDESGNNPMITCENIPEAWKSWSDQVEMVIAIGLESDTTGIKTIPQKPPLSMKTDKRFTKDKPNLPENYVCIRRTYDNIIRIPLCKSLPLSRNYKGTSKTLPTMFIYIAPVIGGKINHGMAISSEKFVIMSKRQPEVLAALKQGKPVTKHGVNSSKRQRRTENIKQLAADNKKLCEQIKMQQQEITKLKDQNKNMTTFLRLFDRQATMAIGSESEAATIMRVMKMTHETISNMHWMKDDIVQAVQQKQQQRI